MPATTTIQSIPCATEEAALASLQGSLLDFSRGGHKVNIRASDVQEMPDGSFIAVMILEIEDEELEEEEQGGEGKKAETSKADEIIERQHDLWAIMHVSGPSLVERSFPEVEAESAVNQGQVEESLQAAENGRLEESEPENLDILAPDQESIDLSRELENEFVEASIPDEDEEAQRLADRESLMAILSSPGRQRGTETPAPTPEE